jgi:hypothetical protein
MSNWTRAHDAWIAEHCEGRKILGPGVMYHDERGGEAGWHDEIPIPNYLTDPAAAIRAAEAWEAKVEGRGWTIESRQGFKTAKLATVPAHPNNFHIVSSDWHRSTAAALAQALYRATGGKP